jgi:ATP-dependent phosphofructokinase / diphosphate-dependent phosphofructokinase
MGPTVEESLDSPRRSQYTHDMADKLAILVGGGPAPGINSVISAATIRAILQRVEVVGIRSGFEEIMQGRVDGARPLALDDVSRIHFRGGSLLGTSRANPTKSIEHLDNVVATLRQLGVTQLITIGGDDTAFSAMKVAERAGGLLRMAHVPKTIDNDLDLEPDVDTFGYQTARHVGVELVKNLMVDARTTSRWYFVVAMGRKAGHLALGIGKAAGATLTLIPEEFPKYMTSLAALVDTLVGAILKRQADGRTDGVAVLAEGLVQCLPADDLRMLGEIEHDSHGHIRLGEIDLGDGLKKAAAKRLAQLGIRTTIVAKDIGYELRCADPIPYDLEYTRDLGYCAAKYLASGGHAAMVSLRAGHFVPIPFAQMLDPETGRTRVRMVDIHSTRYAIARRYMIRLRRDDFEDAAIVARFAKVAHMTPEEFRVQFGHLVEHELPALDLLHRADAARG